VADPVDCIDHGIARRCISDRRHGGGRFCCVCLTVLPVVVCFPPSPAWTKVTVNFERSCRDSPHFFRTFDFGEFEKIGELENQSVDVLCNSI
jgi:hypothetical protein